MVIKGYPKFRSFLVEQNITQTEVAELLGVTREKVNKALLGNRGSVLKTDEIKVLCKHYNLDMQAIFFTDVVPYKQLKS